MQLACFAFALFGLAFAIHWVWWHIRIPRRQTATLLGIFMGVLALGLVLAPRLMIDEAWRPRDGWQTLQVILFHVSMTLAYVVAYSALEERSPSMTLLMYVAAAGQRGRSEAELFGSLGHMTPLKSRLGAMVRDRMIKVEGAAYRITPKGYGWALVLGSWRRLIGLAKGG